MTQYLQLIRVTGFVDELDNIMIILHSIGV